MLNKKAKPESRYHEKFTKEEQITELLNYPSEQEWTGASSTPAEGHRTL